MCPTILTCPSTGTSHKKSPKQTNNPPTNHLRVLVPYSSSKMGGMIAQLSNVGLVWVEMEKCH